jgi:hypothetical protein
MKRTYLPALALALLLTACNAFDSDTSSQAAGGVAVPALAAGSYTVMLGPESAPVVGQYHAGADGTRQLIVDGDDAQARAVYKGAADGSWRVVPTGGDVSFLKTLPLSLASTELSSLAGNYTTRVNDAAVRFSLAANGMLDPAKGESCQLSGQVNSEWLPGVHKLQLKSSGCNGLPASAQGLLIVDPEYAPARFRIVVTDATSLGELWAYLD